MFWVFAMVVCVALLVWTMVIQGKTRDTLDHAQRLNRETDAMLKQIGVTTIAAMVHESHDRAQRKGFVDSPIPERLALIHSEVSEALEDYRVGKMTTTIREDGKPEGFPSELADVCIRCFDLAGQLGIDLEREIRVKSDYNEQRSFKHGNKIC